MDTNKILKVLGLFFVVLGAVIGIGLILSGFAAKSIPLAFMGIVFVMMFCGIGGFFAWIGISMLNRDKKITEEGVAVMGKIFDYVPDYQMTLNGQPTLSLVVRYKRDGVIRQAIVRTGRSDTAEFPHGATVTISLLNGEAGVAATVANARPEMKQAADIVERSYAKMGVLRELRNILGHARDYIAANGEE